LVTVGYVTRVAAFHDQICVLLFLDAYIL